MQAIMISIRPQWVEKILDGIKKDEIRKGTAIGKAINRLIKEQGVAPMLIYCTKGKPTLKGLIAKSWYGLGGYFDYEKLNGKVVARFNATAEEIKYHFGYYNMGEWTESYILENSRLTAEELDNYLQASKEYDETKVSRVYGYDIHINDLEIFDKPKELWQFKKHMSSGDCWTCKIFGSGCRTCSITKAPQSYCFIETGDFK